MHGHKELFEKLGRNDLCPCGSGRRFKRCCMKSGIYDGSRKNYYFRE
ncbi:MAG: SEC-C metal-binding domain-containing protein [Cyanobacteria bacterium P01_F01_bin.150]